jgi:hypothetical protein
MVISVVHGEKSVIMLDAVKEMLLLDPVHVIIL